MPSKALLRSAEVYQTVKRAADFGVEANGIALQFANVQKRKAEIVEKLAGGVKHLMKQGKIDVYEGSAAFLVHLSFHQCQEPSP
ncbi:hypothetical protein ACEQPO_18585 [Bacillus sp. SL00103]